MITSCFKVTSITPSKVHAKRPDWLIFPITGEKWDTQNYFGFGSKVDQLRQEADIKGMMTLRLRSEDLKIQLFLQWHVCNQL